MSENLSHTLALVLESLVGLWEYAEEILKKIRSGDIGAEEMEELAKIIIDSADKAKTEEDFIRMTIAFEKTRIRKVEEDLEKEASQKNLQELLLFDVIY
jgi:hypothetical protein